MTCEGKEFRWTVLCDGFAYDEAYRLMLLSVAGPETSIKAINACLQSKTSGRFQSSDLEPISGRRADSEGYSVSCPLMVGDSEGYETYKTRLGYNTWHLLALSRRDGFMPCLSETSLDRELRSARFTTPYLREWVPWITRQLATTPGSLPALRILPGFQTTAGLLLADSNALDSIVTMGIQDGHLLVPRKAS